MIAACVQNRFSFYNANHQLALERIYARHMSSGITVDNGMQGSTVCNPPKKPER